MSVTIGRGELAKINLLISQGSDNRYSFRYSRDVDGVSTVVDLTRHTARAQFRRSVGGEIYLTLEDEITLRADGVIEISIPASATESDVWDARRHGVWDLELIDPSGGVMRFASGTIEILPDVTRV